MQNLVERIQVQLFDKGCMPITHPTGDWIDLATEYEVKLKAGEDRRISLGIAMKLPTDYEAYVIPRSSTFMKHGIILANSFGLIDNSYCGPDDVWSFHALAVRDTVIPQNTRIAQFRIMRKQPLVIFEPVEKLVARNRGGYGSTGL